MPAPRPARDSSTGTAYVYIAPCRYEDILKLGFSRDPLQRLQSLHPRWYDFFDLAAGALVEVDRVREARALELQLRRAIMLHNAPSPLVIVRAAAGHTEWFRGAGPALLQAIDELLALGHVVHRPLQAWLRPRLDRQSDRLYHWADEMRQAIDHLEHIGDPQQQRDRLVQQLTNALDAYPALGLDLAPRVSTDVLGWRRSRG